MWDEFWGNDDTIPNPSGERRFMPGNPSTALLTNISRQADEEIILKKESEVGAGFTD